MKSSYASIEHVLLLDRLAEHVKVRSLLNLLGQYLRRPAERGGQFFDYERGTSLGYPLSPPIGALFLAELDRRWDRCGRRSARTRPSSAGSKGASTFSATVSAEMA